MTETLNPEEQAALVCLIDAKFYEKMTDREREFYNVLFSKIVSAEKIMIE